MNEQKPQVEEKNIKILFVCDKSIPLLEIDPNFIRMVIQNILSNAVKYTPQKGEIKKIKYLQNFFV